MKNLKKDNKGFSLVELLVVIAIMVVLVGVVAPTLLNNIEKSRKSKDIQNLDSVAAAIQSALADEKAYGDKPTGPQSLSGIYASTGDPATYTDTTEFAKVVREYLPSGGTMDAKLSSKEGKGKTIRFEIKDGTVSVWAGTVASTAPGTDDLSVTR